MQLTWDVVWALVSMVLKQDQAVSWSWGQLLAVSNEGWMVSMNTSCWDGVGGQWGESMLVWLCLCGFLGAFDWSLSNTGCWQDEPLLWCGRVLVMFLAFLKGSEERHIGGNWQLWANNEILKSFKVFFSFQTSGISNNEILKSFKTFFPF